MWVAVTGLAVLGTVLLLRAFVEVSRTLGSSPCDPAAATRRNRVIFIIVTSLFYAGPLTFAYVAMYDRYFLVWVPFALVLVWEGLGRGIAPAETPLPFRLRPLGLASALATIGVSLVFGVVGTHDYLAWNRARWAAGRSLIRGSEVPPEEIEGGSEFNNYFDNLERIHLSRAERYATMPPDQRGRIIAPKLVDPLYRIAVGGFSRYECIRSYPVSAWLPMTPREVLVLKRVGPKQTAE